jgi:hypothetical protein
MITLKSLEQAILSTKMIVERLRTNPDSSDDEFNFYKNQLQEMAQYRLDNFTNK